MRMWSQLPKDFNQRGSNRDLNTLNRVQKLYAQGFVEEIEVDRMIEVRALFELVASHLPLRLTVWRWDRAEVTVRIPECAEPIVSDALKGAHGMASVRDFHAPHQHDVDAFIDRLVLLEVLQCWCGDVQKLEDRAVTRRLRPGQGAPVIRQY